MGVTNIPNGVSSAGTVAQYGVTSVTGAGTVSTSLDTVVGVTASFAGVPGTATSDAVTVAGTAHANTAGAATFILRTYTDAGAAGTAVKSVAWTAFGTKA